jgi:hypothetical protein
MHGFEPAARLKKRLYRSSTSHPTDSFPFEHERRRPDILVESLRRVHKSELRIGAVKKLHRDVEHHSICGRHTTA